MMYKSLMLDVDGTLIPYDYKALPSKKLIQAVKKAQKQVHISLVTGRAYSAIKHILDLFDLHEGYAVTNSGAVVVDIKTKKILYEQPIEKKDTDEIIKILTQENLQFYVKDNPLADVFDDAPFAGDKEFSKTYFFFAEEHHDHEKVVEVFNKLSHIPNLTLHKTRHHDPDKYGFTITHVNATKLHGIEVVMKQLGLKREEIIGVGDSYNDFPLLMASGLKVAMGNAIDDLKEIADYIAPPVTEDGVAHVIEKFILQPQITHKS